MPDPYHGLEFSTDRTFVVVNAAIDAVSAHLICLHLILSLFSNGTCLRLILKLLSIVITQSWVLLLLSAWPVACTAHVLLHTLLLPGETYTHATEGCMTQCTQRQQQELRQSNVCTLEEYSVHAKFIQQWGHV